MISQVATRTASKEGSHPPFLGLHDYEWSGLSAIGTIIAAAVAAGAAWIALRQPVRVLQLEREHAIADANAARTERLREATSAVFDAIDLYVDAVEALRNGDLAEVIQIAGSAPGMKGVLKIFAAHPSMTDGAIFSCTNAGVLMDTLITAGGLAQERKHVATSMIMTRVLPIAHAANQRAIGVRNAAGIPERAKGYVTKMPSPIDTQRIIRNKAGIFDQGASS